jgi:hypothetical protein
MIFQMRQFGLCRVRKVFIIEFILINFLFSQKEWEYISYWMTVMTLFGIFLNLFNLKTFRQSDGLQPHTITIEFQRRTPIDFLVVYLDYKLDESYTPSKYFFII